MSPCVSSQHCTLPCPWAGKGECFLLIVSDTVADHGSLTYGQIAGLQSIYHPHPLPACITAQGRLHYHPITLEEENSPLTEFWDNDSPGL